MIYRLAGVVGVDPAPLTLRQLAWMASAKREHDWALASSLMALSAELARDRRRRGRPFTPDEFNPLVARRSCPIPITVTQLGKLLGLPVRPHDQPPTDRPR